MQDFNNFYKVYRTCDIKDAEKELYKFLNVINEYKKEGIEGIDYNYLFNITYIRLYLVLRERGLIEKSDLYLKKSTEFHSTEKINDEESTVSNIKNVIELDESVKWLKESKVINEIISSESQNEKKIAEFRIEERNYKKAYESDDINIAEKAVHEFIGILLKYKNEGIKMINYDSQLGLAYVRLYFIENQKGNNERAQFYLNKSLNYFSDGRKIDGREAEVKKENIIKAFERLDKHIAGWMK